MIFFKEPDILFRCTHCKAEESFNKKFVAKLEAENRHDSICPLKVECHICHSGYAIPIKYKSKTGKIYNFNKLADKIPHITHDSVDSLLKHLLDEDNF